MSLRIKNHDNTTKDNVTVTSSNISQNKDFEKLTYFCNDKDDIQSQQILAWSKIVWM